MTQEEKQLLLTDLSARLPYGVFCIGIAYELDDDGEKYIPVKVKDTLTEIHNYKLETASVRLGLISSCRLETVKPYLRPMSSMTEEEKEELKSKCIHTETEEDWEGVRCDVWGIQILDKYDTRRWDNPIWPSTINMNAVDWLNAHHFDYRGLIPMGLAIEVTEGNNPYKE